MDVAERRRALEQEIIQADVSAEELAGELDTVVLNAHKAMDVADDHRRALEKEIIQQHAGVSEEELQQLVRYELMNFAWRREKHLQLARDERRALLALRKKTARGQLVELANDSDMFQSCIVKRLPLLTLLELAKVCKGIRDATNGRSDWNRVVVSAMAKRRALLEKERMFAYDRTDKEEWSKEWKVSVKRHDKAVKLFFGLPSALDAVLEYDAAGLLSGFDAHMRIVTLLKTNGPTSYSMMRYEIRLAIIDRKKKLKVHEKAVDEMSDALVSTATKLSTADTRVKTAVAAMVAFLGEHKLKMQSVALTDACAVPSGFAHTKLHVWEDFATNRAFLAPSSRLSRRARCI